MANLIVKPQVEFMEAVKLAYKNCFTFTGRIRRSEFWWAVLGNFIIGLILCFIPIIGQILCLFIGIVNLSLTFRRLHDTNHSGWWVGVPMLTSAIAVGIIITTCGVAALTGDMNALAGASMGSMLIAVLLYLAAGIMELVVLVFCCMDSQQVANKYGESPKYVLDNSIEPNAEEPESQI